MHPMFNAEHVRLRNPLTGRDTVFETNSDSFREMIVQLCDKGLDKKLSKEFDLFAENMTPSGPRLKNLQCQITLFQLKIHRNESNMGRV